MAVCRAYAGNAVWLCPTEHDEYGTPAVFGHADRRHQELPVGDLAADDAHLYLWTTQRYLREAFDVLDAWGFGLSAVLVWSKPPKGVVGTYVSSAEFALFGRRGSLPHKKRNIGTVFEWSRSEHSQKPDAFLDLVEQVSPGPYLELFARRQRLGWDTWGNEALEHVSLKT